LLRTLAYPGLSMYSKAAIEKYGDPARVRVPARAARRVACSCKRAQAGARSASSKTQRRGSTVR
jgi:hypothetical protein